MSNETLSEPLVVNLDGLTSMGIAFSNAHLLRMEAKKKFPRRLSLGQRRVGWLTAEIRAWVSERASRREADAIERSRAAREGAQTRENRRTTKGPIPRELQKA